MSVSLIKDTDRVFRVMGDQHYSGMINMIEAQDIMDKFHGIACNWDAEVEVLVGNEYVWLQVGNDDVCMGDVVIKLPYSLSAPGGFYI
jgi:hypothetical protein